MGGVAAFVLVAALGSGGPAEEPEDPTPMLAFEGSVGSMPRGWGGGPSGTLFSDDKVVHGGAAAGRIERTKDSPREFSTFTASIPMGFKGTTLELRGFLRTESVEGWTGLWLREDGADGPVAFDNMQKQQVRGTTDWTQYTIRLPLEEKATLVVFGALLAGSGKVWVDDLELLVDGKPFGDAPKLERAKTVLDTDREFDGGSKVAIESLTPLQTESLTMLGRVWGFLKYHHPKVVGGGVHWDYALFRVMPHVLAASHRSKVQAAILEWGRGLGEIAACNPCASLRDDLALAPDLAWIHDRSLVGEPLSQFLENVYRNRPPPAPQAYVATVPSVGNPEFRLEKAYPVPAFPDAGTRILALFRWWSVVQYWSPYRDVIGGDWNAVLPEFLPRMVAAKDARGYQAEMLAVIARLNDGHANLWSPLEPRPPRGDCRVPVRLRFVEGKPVVVGYTHAEKGPATGLKVGDALISLDSVAVERLIEPWKPYYPASNEPARLSAIADTLTQGTCGVVQVGVERAGTLSKLTAERIPRKDLEVKNLWTHDLPGPAFRRLSEEVAYLKLSDVKAAEIPDYLRGAAGSRGWIVDIRNYPSEFVVFLLGSHFVTETTPFVRFTMGDLGNPGAFVWREGASLAPLAPHYPGKVVVLVDESTVSSAEYTAMALRASARAIVVGSTTRGADGNVSKVMLPGGLDTKISGIGVFYPDRKPTQRVGIVPDVDVRPTIAGVREGRDEVLEAAVRQILGPDASEAEVRRIARP